MVAGSDKRRIKDGCECFNQAERSGGHHRGRDRRQLRTAGSGDDPGASRRWREGRPGYDRRHVYVEAGLRMLLLAYRTVNAKGGKIALVGLSSDLKDTMSVTGFLDFFTCCDTLDAGVAAVA